jgi:hypothetical protein
MKLNASTGAVMGTYNLGIPGLTGIAFDGTNLWVSSLLSGANVAKVSPDTGLALAYFTAGGDNAFSVVFDGQFVWVATGDGLVTKLNPSDGSTAGVYNDGGLSQSMAFDGANLWVANTNGPMVTKLNVANGNTLASLTIGEAGADEESPGSRALGVVFDGNYIWVSVNGINPSLKKLNGSDGSVAAVYTGFSQPGALAFDGTYIWVADGNSVVKVRDSDGTIVTTTAVGSNPTALAFDGLKMWIANTGGSSVSRR